MDNPETPAIVVTERSAGMGIVLGLAREGVPIVAGASGGDAMISASRHVERTIELPGTSDDDSLINRLLDDATQHGRALLVPATDATLVALSRHREVLRDHFDVGCTDWAVTEQYIDKLWTYRLAESIGVACPKTLAPDEIGEVESYADEVQYPCLVKPREGHLFVQRFGTKMFPVADSDELLEAYAMAVEADLKVMIQEFIPGDDREGVNYNAFTWNGRQTAEFTARKVRNSPPQYGSPRVVVSEHIPEIVEPGRRLLRALDYEGFSCTEFKFDRRDSTYKLMEVNGRHNQSAKLAIRCGMNFPWIEYSQRVLGLATDQTDFEDGVFWIDPYDDLKQSVKHWRDEPSGLRWYLRPYVSPKIFESIDRREPGLTWRRFSKAFSSVTRRD